MNEQTLKSKINMQNRIYLFLYGDKKRHAEASRLNGFMGASTNAVNHDIIKHDDNPTNQAVERQPESRRIEQ